MTGGARPPRPPLPPIDFAGLNDVLLRQAETLVPDWLPGGKRVVREWVCADLSGGEGGSCSVNLDSGKWGDFSCGDSGGDLISLFAAIKGVNNGKAAAMLMEDLGIRRGPSVQSPAQPAPAAAKAAPAPAAKPERVEKRKGMWRAIVPVPDFAPPVTFNHFSRKPEDLLGTWEYRFNGALYGYVARFSTSDGGKETLPITWCVDESDDRGTQKWHWKHWDAPKPLYVPFGELAADPALVPVLLVEGEKCAKTGFDLLPAEFDWVTWPGGTNAWDKAQWEWLRDRVVYLWPDCDAKRVKLSKAEREAGVDEASKPLLPEAQQPGMKAMVNIARSLEVIGCTLLMVKVPKPGEVKDGWDVADAIEQGWDAETVRAFIRSAVPYLPPSEAGAAPRDDGASTPSPAAAGGGSPPARAETWFDYLLWGKTGPLPVRENVVAALEGVQTRDGQWVPGVRACEGVIAYNSFTNDVVKLRDAPWGSPAGLWREEDELHMGEWLVRRHALASCARGTLEEAVRMVAARHQFHPVRAYLEALTWDGTPRLATWLRRCCLQEPEGGWNDADDLQQYLARVGTWFLQGMASRAMQPGVKFDYMLILEGGQGMGKSTLLKVLAGDWFADTGLNLGDKDSYQQLQGRWLYEFAELDAFGKADTTKIKSFVASPSDYFRASFDRRARDYPRQVVFGGTTNEERYLTDSTGNRRMWPMRVTRQIDLAWLAANRDQLFAEAMDRYRKGRRMFPKPAEETKLFVPQQRARVVDSGIGGEIADYLETPDGTLITEITLVKLLGKIGIGLEKLGPGRFHEKQAAAQLREMGWTEGGREPSKVDPKRARRWCKPADKKEAPSPAPAVPGDVQRAPQAQSTQGDSDDCPF